MVMAGERFALDSEEVPTAAARGRVALGKDPLNREVHLRAGFCNRAFRMTRIEIDDLADQVPSPSERACVASAPR
jgi:hypothetical protein